MVSGPRSELRPCLAGAVSSLRDLGLILRPGLDAILESPRHWAGSLFLLGCRSFHVELNGKQSCTSQRFQGEALRSGGVRLSPRVRSLGILCTFSVFWLASGIQASALQARRLLPLRRYGWASCHHIWVLGPSGSGISRILHWVKSPTLRVYVEGGLRLPHGALRRVKRQEENWCDQRSLSLWVAFWYSPTPPRSWRRSWCVLGWCAP